jgi:hypothetical protein
MVRAPPYAALVTFLFKLPFLLGCYRGWGNRLQSDHQAMSYAAELSIGTKTGPQIWSRMSPDGAT